MVSISDLCPYCVRTTSSTITSPSSDFIVFHLLQFCLLENIKWTQIRRIIFLTFPLNTSIVASRIQVSLVKSLLPGFISMYRPCLGVQVSGQPYDTTTLGHDYNCFSSQTQGTLPPACNAILQRTRCKQLQKTSSSFWNEKQSQNSQSP